MLGADFVHPQYVFQGPLKDTCGSAEKSSIPVDVEDRLAKKGAFFDVS